MTDNALEQQHVTQAAGATGDRHNEQALDDLKVESEAGTLSSSEVLDLAPGGGSGHDR